MTIHKEGRLFLLYLFLVITGINSGLYHLHGAGISLFLSIVVTTAIFLIVLQFFRSPVVVVKLDQKHVLSPADGKVVVIEKVHFDEFIDEDRIQISIFMSLFNVHVNRNPVSGIIRYFRYHAGSYMVAWHPKSSDENERTTVIYELSNGLLLPVRQIAGTLARRIMFYIREGSKVMQGEEFGFIKFGSRLDIMVPVDAVIKVNIGDKVVAGESILAELTS
jgi:phosphatidylserine decarboxylase